MKKCLLYFSIIVIFFACDHLQAQLPVPGYGVQHVLGGYDSYIEGELLPYFSSYQQFAKEAMLTRCTDGKKVISWRSVMVPEDFDADYCYFYFLAGHSTGTSKAERHFDFYIDHRKVLTFTTPLKKTPPFNWSFSGVDSVQLIFEATFQDIHTDAHGNLFLKVPKKLLTPGEPLTFSVAGENENSNDWFMIFRYPYTEKVVVEPSSLLVQTQTGIKQVLRIKVDHTGQSVDTLKLLFPKGGDQFVIHPGYNYFELPVDTVSKVAVQKIYASVGKDFGAQFSIRISPIHRREVDIIHHSHNDIGYSNLQEDVAKIQTGNIRSALHLIEQTKNYPEGAKFIWNIESVWAVDNFLGEASGKEKDAFFNAVRKKQICLSGHYANILTGLCNPEEMDWITERAVKLRNQFQLPINSVMLTDIPGVNWSEVQSLASHGFSYFSCGPNYQPQFPDLGERIGGTIRELGDKPFYWLGADGKSKILMWVAGRGYSMFHQIPSADLDEKRKDKLSAYMTELDSAQYPYDIVQLRYAIKTDNGPTDSTLCDFVKTWNEKYVSPKLVISTVSGMMEKFESRYAKQLPVLSGDFTPYWEDGAYSTAREEGEVRVASSRILQLQKFFELNPSPAVDTNWFYRARRSVVMFHEHTWGSWNSVSEPDIPFTTQQWEYKKRFCDSAKIYVQRIEEALIQVKKDYRTIEVWNTLPWVRSGFVVADAPPAMDSLNLWDDKGNWIPFQPLRNGKIGFVAHEVPFANKSTYSFSKQKLYIDELPFLVKPRPKIDSLTGAIFSFGIGREHLIDTSLFKGINSALYMAGLYPGILKKSKVKLIRAEELGYLLDKLEVNCSIEGATDFKYDISYFNILNVYLFSVVINKQPIREKESVHIAFPFTLKDVITRIGISDTFITPEHGQLSAGNRDYYSVQRWIDVSDSTRGVTISSPQCALWEVGNLIDERRVNRGEKLWRKENKSSATIFAYAMNNYWHTNYKADQEGIAQFDFYIQLHDKFSLQDAERFGKEVSNPLIVIQK